MIKEIDLFGVFVPPMFAYAAAAGLVWFILRKGLVATDFYRFVWHPALFNAALYVLILAGLVALVFR
jgi:protein AaeX